MHADSRQIKSFYLLLGVIFFAHIAVMLSKLNLQFSSSDDWTKPATPPAIKVNISPETIRAMAIEQKKQIVQSEDSNSTAKPKEAFLSDKDRSFDRETIARNNGIFKKTGLGDSSVNRKAETKTAETKETKPQAKPNLKDLKLSDIGMPAIEPVHQPSRAPASASTEGMKTGNPADRGLSATNDYVEEVALGDFTHLNTVEYKFYGFYHRIRQKLEQFWGKSIQEKADSLFRSGRRLPASSDLVTSLQVTMDAKGEIVGVKVLGASGVKELDDAAIESFNQAGPFPNPPKELLVNGKVTIDWGFVVKS